MILNIFNFAANKYQDMIQRIQTLYLLVAALLVAALFFVPFAELMVRDGNLYQFDIFGIFQEGDNGGTSLINTWPVTVLVCLSVIMLILTILMYKNRPRQVTFSYSTIGLILSFQGLINFYAWSGNNILGETYSLRIYAGLPLVAVIFVFLAIRGIKKDENLVKSIDRIR